MDKRQIPSGLEATLPQVSRDVLSELLNNPDLIDIVDGAAESFCEHNDILRGLMRGYVDIMPKDRALAAYSSVAMLCYALEEQAGEMYVQYTPEGLPIMTEDVRERIIQNAQTGNLKPKILSVAASDKYIRLFAGVNFFLGYIGNKVQHPESTKVAVSFAYLLLGEESKRQLKKPIAKG